MSFVPRLNSNGMYNNPWWYSNGNVFYSAGYGLPNCTCYAYGRYAEIRNAFAPLPTGDAGEWYDAATSFSRGQTPKLGAVVCYGDDNQTNPGHVAIVEVINSDGSIVTSNSAYNSTYFWTETVTASSNYTPTWAVNRGYHLQGFIYNDATEISPYVVAAMCGCFSRESTVNPGVWENLQPPQSQNIWHELNVGFGLGQWTNTNGDTDGRLWELHDWVTHSGYTDGDGNGQMDFLVNKEKTWYNSEYTRGNYTSLAEFLASGSTNLEDLTWDFLANWEGMPGDAFNQRYAAAQVFYDYIVAHKNDDPSQYTWLSSNGYLSMANNTPEQQNNVMCIYFWFTDYSPTPPTPPTPTERTSMPLWMMLRYLP